jgi:hypothetical protein
MNIFFLSLNIASCAKYYLNKHCVKIILEIAQMLYTAHWMSDDPTWVEVHHSHEAPYRKTHFNHPTSKWVRQCETNYLFTCRLGLALCHEYTLRYGKVHKTQHRIEWLLHHIPSSFCTDPISARLATCNIPDGCTPVPLAMPEQYHSDDLLYSYRYYYLDAKTHVQTATDADRYAQLKQDSTVVASVVQ